MDFATLSIGVKSEALLRAERQLDDLAATGGRAERSLNRSMDRVEDGFERAERGARRANDGLDLYQRGLQHFAGFAAQAAGAIAGALSVGAVARATEEYTRLSNGLRVLGLSAAEASQTLEQINEIATRTRSPLAATAELYQRVSVAAGEMGASQADVLRFTENVGLALAQQGTSAAAASGALLQLSQAMAGGTVRAEEFNSILEGAFPLAQAAARGIDEAGGSVGRLRQLVIEGKISSEEFFNAILSQSGALEAAFATSVPTISQAFGVLGNNLIITIGQMDQTLGISAAVANAILLVAENVDRLAVYVAAAGVAFAAVYTPAIIAGAVALGRLVAGLVATRAALLRTGFGVLVVALGEATYQVIQLAERMGGFGNLVKAVGDLAVEVWERIGNGTNFVVQSVIAMAYAMQTNFLMALNRMLSGFVEFTNSVADGINALFGTGLTGMSAEITQEIGRSAIAADDFRASAQASADAAAKAFTSPLKSVEAFTRSTVAGTKAVTGLGTNGKSALSGVAGAAGGAARAVEDLNEQGQQTPSWVNGVADAFGEFVASGFRDFKGFARSIVDTFRNMIAQMIATAVANPIKIALGIGGTGIAGAANAGTGGGGLFSGLIGSFGQGQGLAGLGGGTGFLGGLGNVVGGFSTGGFGGAFSAIGKAFSGITSGIGGFASAIGAALPVVGAIGLVLSAFRKKVTELDSGLRVTISGMDAVVETFRTTETKRFFGLSKRVATGYAAAKAEVEGPVQTALDQLGASTRLMAQAIGATGSALDTFAYQFSVSTKGLSQSDAQQAITDAFGKVSDEMARLILAEAEGFQRIIETTTREVTTTLGGRGRGGALSELMSGTVTNTVTETVDNITEFVSKFQREGETAGQTLQRLSDAIGAVNGSLQFLGKTMFDVSIAGADMASQLVDAFGGVEALQSATQSYFQNFYSEAEQLALRTDALGRSFAALGVAMPATMQQFRALVEAQDLTTEAGRKLYAGLLSVSGEFAAVTNAVNQALQSAVDQARNGLQSAVTAEQSAINAQIQALQTQRREAEEGLAIAERLRRSARDVLGLNEELVEIQRQSALRQLRTMLETGRIDRGRIDNLVSSATSFGDTFKTREDMLREQVKTASLLEALGVQQENEAMRQMLAIEEQIFLAEQQIEALDKLLVSNGIVNNSVLSVASAVSQLSGAINALAAAQSAAAASAPVAVGSPTFQQAVNEITANPSAPVTQQQAQAILGGQIGSYADPAAAAAFQAQSSASLAAWVASLGIPSFADGGMHSGGIALVGERGPEFVNMGPSRVFNAEQTQRMLGGGNADEVKALRAEMQKNNEYMRELVKINLKQERELQEIRIQGEPA
ncbi:MAG: tape measure protein [Fuscovulum sp.]|nr:MAG: tape measure protein [Fuscovulum sp.]